ncbi:MobA protein [Paramuribaculum intestinale]|nr:MobA protein [Paramuribaculum intestinale]
MENRLTPAATSVWKSAITEFHYMSKSSCKGGRPPKIEATEFRCSVNFSASEHARLLSMYEKSGAYSMSSFIKAQVFQKPFKVFFFDENTRIFIDRLAGFNSLYRTFGISYDNLVKTLYLNFTEKKANAALFELKKLTMQLVSLNQDIVALAKKFDEQWSQKSQ